MISKIYIISLLLFYSTSYAHTKNEPSDSTIVIALKQRNVDNLESIASLISDPNSVHYGKYMTSHQINKMIGYKPVEIRLLLTWLINHGHVINDYNWDSIVINTKNPSDLHILPNLFNYVEFVQEEPDTLVSKRSPIDRSGTIPTQGVLDTGLVTREVLDRIYNIPKGGLVSNVSGGLMEYQGGNGFSQDDLLLCQLQNSLPPNPISSKHVIGAPSYFPDGESELDVQMLGTVAGNAVLWYESYHGWMYKWAVDFFNRKETPQVVSVSWGWSESDQCSIVKCNNITSKEYVHRTNVEFMKLALKGTTIVVASGDAGSPGRTNENCFSDHPNMNPVFPGSSKWVTSVGATFLLTSSEHYDYQTPVCRTNQCAMGTIEQGTTFNQTGWTSGAGFSKWTTRPKWQHKEVSTYLSKNIQFPNQRYWNKYGRAYPDVSSIGHSCGIVMDGMWGGEDGTSCSAPIFAGILVLLNDHQLKKDKPLLGFANPLLYDMYEKMKDTFNDVTVGFSGCTETQCCGKDYGFVASKGWDSVSGLGTPNVQKMYEYLDKYTH